MKILQLIPVLLISAAGYSQVSVNGLPVKLNTGLQGKINTNLTVQSGTTISNDGQLAIDGNILNGGTLSGTGSFSYTGTITNTGIVAPGNSPGILSLTGNYDCGTSAMDIEVGGNGGAGVANGHDQLAVTGPAIISGTLNVSLINGFTPSLGNQYVIVTFTSHSGGFSTVNLPDISPNYFNVRYNPTNITLTVDGFVLPLRLLEFSGLLAGNAVKLSWKIEEDLSVGSYDLEWSEDGVHFNTLLTTVTANRIPGINQYAYTHSNIKPVNYYRLRLREATGSFSYSQVLRIGHGGKQDVLVYPNPAKDMVVVNMPDRGQAVLQLFNATGQLVWSRQVESNATTISIGHLPKGMYRLLIEQNGKLVSKGILKE